MEYKKLYRQVRAWNNDAAGRFRSSEGGTLQGSLGGDGAAAPIILDSPYPYGGVMRARAEVKFTGLVQGVSFRAYTQRWAIVQRVNGWVRNMPDGSVAAVFEGEREDIEEVIRRLREEHPLARVDDVQVRWGPDTGEYDSFSIRR